MPSGSPGFSRWVPAGAATDCISDSLESRLMNVEKYSPNMAGGRTACTAARPERLESRLQPVNGRQPAEAGTPGAMSTG